MVAKTRIGPGISQRFKYVLEGAEATLEMFEDGFAYLEDIWVDPGSRGTGLGRRLLHHIEEDARMMGASEIGCHPKAYERGPGGAPALRAEAEQRLCDWYRECGWAHNTRDDEAVQANRGTWK